MSANAVSKPNGQLILASISPRRLDLLKALGLDFEVIPSQVEETIEPHRGVEDVVVDLAWQKSREVYHRIVTERGNDPILVLGADTIVLLDKQFLGKPRDKEEAMQMLARLSGRVHEVYTGVCLITNTSGSEQIFKSCERSKVHFRRLEEPEIAAYVETGEPMDKAGAYALQGIGAALVARIEGSHTNIVGLPIPNVVSLLRQAGYAILGISASSAPINPA